ncbi:MAG TPA: GNAT family N-acetyltransferase [Kofleriaceae bacterium]
MPIRACEPEDFAAFTAITNAIITTSATHFGYEPYGPSELAGMWRNDRERFPWLSLVAEDGTPIGYAKAGTWRARDAYRWTCETAIYLHESARGRGQGKELYQALLDECARRDFHSVMAGITLPNAASVRLHESLGFVSTGVVRDAGKKLDRWHDVGFWQRML